MLRSGKTKKSLFFPAAAGLFLLFTASHRIILFQRKIIVLFGSRYSSKKIIQPCTMFLTLPLLLSDNLRPLDVCRLW